VTLNNHTKSTHSACKQNHPSKQQIRPKDIYQGHIEHRWEKNSLKPKSNPNASKISYLRINYPTMIQTDIKEIKYSTFPRKLEVINPATIKH